MREKLIVIFPEACRLIDDMRRNLFFVGCTLCLLLGMMGGSPAQSLLGSTPETSNQPAPSTASPHGTPTSTTIPYPRALPVEPMAPSANQSASSPSAAGSDASAMTASDFVINGVSYAKVLYLEGNVWIRPPGEESFHLLTEDEPIAEWSIIHTGFNGILDFATGPGMATRMVPETSIFVRELPQPSTPPGTPQTTRLGMKDGTIFSALGRDDGQAVDYQVRTPEGVAGARGTMFATSASTGQVEVSMLHGTVKFEAPDHQTSQISAGDSQQITEGTLGKYQFHAHHALNPASASEFFNHAGGLLEHASGYGVVRRGLGPDVARSLHERGYKLSAGAQERFQNAGKVRYQHRPAFNRAPGVHPGAGQWKANPKAPGSHALESHLTPAQQKEKESVDRRFRNENGINRKDKPGGNGWNGGFGH